MIKAEVVRLDDREPRDNPRFVVTNLRHAPRYVYEKVYCARGDIENRIKELLDGLQIDRTSCCRFWPNQLRVLMTAAAYVLMQELRLRAARTACARTQVTWLRDRLLKLGAHRRLRPAHGVAPASQHTRPRRLAAHRPRPRCTGRIENLPHPASRAPNTATKSGLGGSVVKETTFRPVRQSKPVDHHRSTAETLSGRVAPRSAGLIRGANDRSRTPHE